MVRGGYNDMKDELQKSGLSSVVNPKTISLGVFGVVLVLVLFLAPNLVETTKSGWFNIKQAPISGKMTAYTKPGMFFQGFGDVFCYKQADILYFSKHDNEGGDLDEATSVRFNDGATAMVTSNVRVELPADPVKLLEIHKKFRSYKALIKDTVKQIVSESVILTSALMSAEESYTTKRAQFSQIANDQVQDGIYLTESVPSKTKEDGKEKEIVRIKRDKDGKPMRKEAVLSLYGIRVTQFVIKEIDYEETVDKQINTKQQALMKTVAAKAEAEKAQQDRKTAEEVGKKNVAVAKYEKEVEKIQEVTDAQKKLEVARLDRKAAAEYKQKKILEAAGDAEYKRKVMQADGALKQKLDAYIEVQKVWAAAMKDMKNPLVPQINMGGQKGGASNGALTFMELMGVKAAKDMMLELKPKK